MNDTFRLDSPDLRDAAGSYPDALTVRGYGLRTQVALYVSKDACQSAQGEILIDVVCSEISNKRVD